MHQSVEIEIHNKIEILVGISVLESPELKKGVCANFLPVCMAVYISAALERKWLNRYHQTRNKHINESIHHTMSRMLCGKLFFQLYEISNYQPRF